MIVLSALERMPLEREILRPCVVVEEYGIALPWERTLGQKCKAAL